MENENNKHYPFGRKQAEGFAAHVDVSAGTDMSPGLLSPMNPIGAGTSSPFMPQPATAREKPRR